MTTSHNRRRLAVAALTVTTVTAIAGCASTGAGESAPVGDPVEGGTLTLEFWPDNPSFTCLDPFQTYWIESRQIVRNFAESLTDQDPETGEIVPWLATDWQISDDGLSYTFDLRDDVTFSDGSPFDANAVVTAFDDAEETVATVPGVFGASYIAGYESTTALDEHTVRIDFSTPNAAFLQGTSTSTLAILSPGSYELTPEQRCLAEGISGTGPFVLEQYSPSGGTVLNRRDDYDWASELNAHQGPAYLDRVQINYIAEDSVRVGNLTSGASDIAWPRNPFTPEQSAQIEGAGASIESRAIPGVSSAYFPNATQGEVLSDPLVRSALQKSIDRAEYAATIYGASYPVVASAYDSTTPFALDQSEELAYDPDAAADLLDEAGWTLEDGATYRTKDGAELTISLPITVDNPGDALLQDQLKRVGIDLQLDVIQAADRGPRIAEGDYDLLGSYLTRGDPSVLGSILDPTIATSKAFAVNAVPAESAAELQGLFAAGLSTIDPADREAVYGDIQRLVVDDGIVFPIFERVQQVGVAPEVHGFRFASESPLSWYDLWKSGE